MMFYITFGSEGHVFVGGWLRVKADSMVEAIEKFKDYCGEEAINERGQYRYAFVYSEESFKETRMSEKGNFGAFEHEYIE